MIISIKKQFLEYTLGHNDQCLIYALASGYSQTASIVLLCSDTCVQSSNNM